VFQSVLPLYHNRLTHRLTAKPKEIMTNTTETPKFLACEFSRIDVTDLIEPESGTGTYYVDIDDIDEDSIDEYGTATAQIHMRTRNNFNNIGNVHIHADGEIYTDFGGNFGFKYCEGDDGYDRNEEERIADANTQFTQLVMREIILAVEAAQESKLLWFEDESWIAEKTKTMEHYWLM